MIVNEKDILNIMKENNGFLAMEDIEKYEISIKKIQQMARDDKVERLVRGLYIHPDFFEDPFFICQYRAPKAIFSNETALYLHLMSDENPLNITVTIPSGYNSILLKEDNFKFYYLKEDVWSLGQEEILSPFGNKIKVYSKERTLAEMMTKSGKVDRGLFINALKIGLAEDNLDRLELIKYAEIFGSKEQMRNYIEVLL